MRAKRAHKGKAPPLPVQQHAGGNSTAHDLLDCTFDLGTMVTARSDTEKRCKVWTVAQKFIMNVNFKMLAATIRDKGLLKVSPFSQRAKTTKPGSLR